jgi:hypothetical protein
MARNLVCSEKQCNSLEDFTQLCRGEDTDSMTKMRSIDRSDLRNIHHACAREPRFSSPKPDIARHLSQPKVRGNSRDHSGRDRASVEAVVLYYQGGSTTGRR